MVEAFAYWDAYEQETFRMEVERAGFRPIGQGYWRREDPIGYTIATLEEAHKIVCAEEK